MSPSNSTRKTILYRLTRCWLPVASSEAKDRTMQEGSRGSCGPARARNPRTDASAARFFFVFFLQGERADNDEEQRFRDARGALLGRPVTLREASGTPRRAPRTLRDELGVSGTLGGRSRHAPGTLRQASGTTPGRSWRAPGALQDGSAMLPGRSGMRPRAHATRFSRLWLGQRSSIGLQSDF